MNSNKTFHKIALEFVGGESDRAMFSTRLRKLKGLKSFVYANPTYAEEWVYSHASSSDFVVNSVVMIIAATANIAAIAHLLYDFLKDRARKKEIDRRIMGMAWVGKIPQGADQVVYGRVANKVVVKSDSKEVEMTGDFSKDDIIKILETSATIANFEEASNWLRKKENELKKFELRQELGATEQAVTQYQALLTVYEKDDKLEFWQKRDYLKYKRRMNRLKNEIEQLRKRLKRLEAGK